MADDIEVTEVPQAGIVSLTCGPEAFARLLAAVSEVAGREIGGPFEVRSVQFGLRRPPTPPVGWGEWIMSRVAFVGCATVLALAGMVFVAGVMAVSGRLR